MLHKAFDPAINQFLLSHKTTRTFVYVTDTKPAGGYPDVAVPAIRLPNQQFKICQSDEESVVEVLLDQDSMARPIRRRCHLRMALDILERQSGHVPSRLCEKSALRYSTTQF